MLKDGTKLGPYEILASLGAGGMGEVYRARDTRLGREVAIKVLPSSFSHDPDRLRRFEQEARAISLLNHPNILAIHDVGTHEGSPYLVSELLEGETLRERLRGAVDAAPKGAAAPGSPVSGSDKPRPAPQGVAIPPRKALDYATQIAHGLAAAHEKGITHRDLKPENIFLTKDGRVKILDFGLAKLVQPEGLSAELTSAPTTPSGTEPGMVMGSVGYMSPEQVRGQPTDQRSDIFSFGVILYEMLSGRRAFYRETGAETMTAILKEDPPDLAESSRSISPGLERIVDHCLEKNPEQRFQSTRDLAFNLEALSVSSTQAAVAATAGGPAISRRRTVPAMVGLALLAGVALGYLAAQRAAKTSPPVYHQLTFRRGTINSARFTPDGQTILYDAMWEGQPSRVFTTRPDSTESRPLDLPEAEVLSISSSGELALALQPHELAPYIHAGILSRVPLAGGAPREILEDVQAADWSPDGSQLAVVRRVGRRNRLEYPIGRALYEADGWIASPRFSPKGDRIAFLDHPVLGDDGGSVAVADLQGHKQTLASGWLTEWGTAWSPSGDEVWFSATATGANRAIYAVSLSGKLRLVTRAPGCLRLLDISHDGRVMLSEESNRQGILGHVPGSTGERDLSWLDYSGLRDLSSDGKTILFVESGEGGGSHYSNYIRQTDGSPAVRLGDGNATALSADGKWVASADFHQVPTPLVLLPTGPGETKRLADEKLSYMAGWFLPDGKRVVVRATEANHPPRFYVQEIEGGKLRPIGPESTEMRGRHPISLDGKFIALFGPDQKLALYPIDGGEPQPVPGFRPEEFICQWSADGRSIFVEQPGPPPVKVYKMDIATGRRELWKEIAPADPAGVVSVGLVRPSADENYYAYSYVRVLSSLFLVQGLK